MKLTIDNRTEYLNDYHFQTLCLLYYPGEKFPPDIEKHENDAFFSLYEDKGVFNARVILKCGDRSSTAEFSASSCDHLINYSNEDVAAYVIGKAYLDAGSKLFGFLPPWGYLTGLRPVKRAKYYLDRGYSESRVNELFCEGYSVSVEKSDLSIETAKNETEYLKGVGEEDCCLYVAIPFCPTRCEYCSFVSYSNAKLFKLIPDYLTRLFEDIEKTANIIKSIGKKLKYIYIGGGTPSFLTNEQIGRLLDRINGSFDMSSVREYTFEAGRPDCITREKLETVRSHGIGRISVNPQTTSDAVLQRIGRHHTVKQFFDAAELAMSVGFDNINADLIAGLPSDTDESFYKSLDDIIGLGFSNITVHTLSVKNAAPIRFDENDIYDANGTRVRKNVEESRRILASHGYYPYYLYRQKNTVGNGENTGFALNGRGCLYNILMMEEVLTVFACGASSITKLVNKDGTRIDRIAFPKYPFEYLETEHDIGEDRIRSFFGI